VPSHYKNWPDSEIFDKSNLRGGYPLFRELGHEARDQLAAFTMKRNVERGRTIFSKGDIGTCLFAVCSGIVKVIVPSIEGRTAVFNLVRDGEIFGEIALLDGGTRTANAVAFTDCKLIVIERRDFLSLLRAYPDVAIRLLEVLCSRLRQTTEQVEDLMFLDLRSRLVKTLLRLSQVGTDGEISISQDDLSQIVGLSREMINKQLQVWVKGRWIKLARKRITIIEPEALAGILAEE
jgi:CRP/FNR family cyclic AMP-dependent transcriptional regulator